jgi:hypothetical protein
MINDQTTALPDDQHLTALIGLVRSLTDLMSDPAATKKRIDQLSAAHADAKAAIAKAAVDREAADKRVADAEAEVVAARERHGLERDQHHARIAEERKDIEELGRAADADRKAAAADRTQAAKIRETIERKLKSLAETV